ncbi:MAG: hypothetical protein PSV35_03800 [bacterium]|nr:hypothetical protein [bacterium]
MDCYLVWAVSGSTVQVIATTNAARSLNWSQNSLNIPGITEIDTYICNGLTVSGANDGACNTGQIVAKYGTPYDNYAAGLCYGITLDNSGSVSAGTWYLPAICQMGGASQGAGCSSGLANIDTNLFQLGFGGLTGSYWSSTEYSVVPDALAWLKFFASGGSGVQFHLVKSAQFGVRCSRELAF